MIVQISWINIREARASHCFFSVDVSMFFLLKLTSDTFWVSMEEDLEREYIKVSVLFHFYMTKNDLTKDNITRVKKNHLMNQLKSLMQKIRI